MSRNRFNRLGRGGRCIASVGLISALLVAAVPVVSAAGPQALPGAACNAGTQNAAQHAPNRASSEAIPHIEHSPLLPPVPYCHHFNPTAEPPPVL